LARTNSLRLQGASPNKSHTQYSAKTIKQEKISHGAIFGAIGLVSFQNTKISLKGKIKLNIL
jgi:hypothetical protein